MSDDHPIDKAIEKLAAMTGQRRNVLPEDSKERKDIPLCSGVLDYFESALAEVAKVSKAGNDKHNPGLPLHHARGKSNDHADCILRHLVDRGNFYEEKLPDGRVIRIRHSAGLAWRALALLQEELEAAGAPLARGARLPNADALPVTRYEGHPPVATLGEAKPVPYRDPRCTALPGGACTPEDACQIHACDASNIGFCHCPRR